MNLNFLECYKILGITDECDWASFKKNYKSLIQQHHPDRFTENTPEHVDSEKSIRHYNAAYKIISDYYQLNKSLPPHTEDIYKTEKPKPIQRKKRPPASHTDFLKRDKPKLGIVRPVIFSAILLGIFVIVMYQTYSEEDNNSERVLPVQKITKKITFKEVTSQPQDSSKKDYYSIGSSLGEVIIIQGKPDYILESVWYYGKSSITFKNGVVSSWDRHPEHPLKIHLSQPMPFSYKKPETPVPDNTRKPYWKK